MYLTPDLAGVNSFSISVSHYLLYTICYKRVSIRKYVPIPYRPTNLKTFGRLEEALAESVIVGILRTIGQPVAV
jgi:hypothetical protein